MGFLYKDVLLLVTCANFILFSSSVLGDRIPKLVQGRLDTGRREGFLDPDAYPPNGEKLSERPKPRNDESSKLFQILAPSLTASHPDEGNNVTSRIREKRQDSRKDQIQPRTFGVDIDIGPGFPPGSPLCFEREVSGTCRYRSSPEECFRHEWTAYATIINHGYKKVTSIPEGLHVHPGGHPRVRVFLKLSCCTPVVQFIATDLFLQPNVCLVDVRELQDLHPGEIVGIVLGCLLFIIVLIAVIACCFCYQRRKKEKDTVIFGRSLTRSKSGTGSMNHR